MSEALWTHLEAAEDHLQAALGLVDAEIARRVEVKASRQAMKTPAGPPAAEPDPKQELVPPPDKERGTPQAKKPEPGAVVGSGGSAGPLQRKFRGELTAPQDSLQAKPVATPPVVSANSEPPACPPAAEEGPPAPAHGAGAPSSGEAVAQLPGRLLGPAMPLPKVGGDGAALAAHLAGLRPDPGWAASDDLWLIRLLADRWNFQLILEEMDRSARDVRARINALTDHRRFSPSQVLAALVEGRAMSLGAEFLALRPSGGFGLIMADPPWRFRNFSEAGEAKNPVAHYGCEAAELIAAMPVELLAAPDCLLWLWATNPMLPEALAVLAAWGFTFKTAGTWVKRTTRGRDAFGTGYVLRSSNEPFLIGARGSPRTTRATRSTVATYDDGFHSACAGGDWPKGSITIEAVVREHSRKPEEAFQAAEALMPGAQRLELFSRQTRQGWTGWGNEAGKFDADGVVEGVAG